MNRRWLCNDVWMDILPFFDFLQLVLKLALISPHFCALVDAHFNGKSELTIWSKINKHKGIPKLSVLTNCANSVQFPLSDRPLPNKIRFKCLLIKYIDHSVIAFLRANQQIFDRRGTNLRLYVSSSSDDTDAKPIWNVFVRQILPIFASNICHLDFFNAKHLDNLLRLKSPTILTDLKQLNSIYAKDLFPDTIDGVFDGPNATSSAGQALSKWLHTPTTDGQLKRLFCNDCCGFNWVNEFKEKFCRATTFTASYKIQFFAPKSMVVPFELVNDGTHEKLTLLRDIRNGSINRWIMKRCQIGETAAIHWEKENLDDLSTVQFMLFGNKCIGPLSAPKKPDKASQKGRLLTMSDGQKKNNNKQ